MNDLQALNTAAQNGVIAINNLNGTTTSIVTSVGTIATGTTTIATQTTTIAAQTTTIATNTGTIATNTGNLVTAVNSLTAAYAGAFVFPYTAITAAYNVKNADYLIQSNGASGVPTFPTAVGITAKPFIFKNNSGGSITPFTTSTQTIDGSAPAAISNHGVLRIYSDGSNWQTW